MPDSVSVMFSSDIRFSLADMVLYLDIQLLYVWLVLYLANRFVFPVSGISCQAGSPGTRKQKARYVVLGVFFLLLFAVLSLYVIYRLLWFWRNCVDVSYIVATLPQTAFDWAVMAAGIIALGVLAELVFRVARMFRNRCCCCNGLPYERNEN